MTAILRRNNVKVSGQGEVTLMLAHGFGCNQEMWRHLIPFLTERYQIIAFDYVGLGESDIGAFDTKRYSHLEGFAEDVVEICEALQLPDIHFVAHSVSGMIGLLADRISPSLFASISMVCPSPCYLNKPPEYYGGFERSDLQDLVDLMDKNYIGWAQRLAPLVMGKNMDEFVEELEVSFCSTDPVVAKTFANATFFGDHRELLAAYPRPALIIQSSHDALAQPEVGEYMHSHMPDSRLKIIEGEGHCLHMTHPAEVAQAIDEFIETLRINQVPHTA